MMDCCRMTAFGVFEDMNPLTRSSDYTTQLEVVTNEWTR